MWKLILKVGLFSIIFTLGVFVAVVAMRCDRGHILLVNALEIDQPGLRLYGSSGKQSLLWAGSLPAGEVEELFLQEPLGSNMVLEGTNAATGQRFSEQSYYVVSLPPYGTYMYLIEPYGVRTIIYRDDKLPGNESTPLFFFLREMLRLVFHETRCVDADIWRWWNR